MNQLQVTLLTVAMAGLCACGDKPTEVSGPAPAADPPAANAGAGAIGVPECDQFLTRYEACLSDSVPAAARAALEQSLAATRSGWQQAAATPAGREGLAVACRQARESSRMALQAYGCSDF